MSYDPPTALASPPLLFGGPNLLKKWHKKLGDVQAGVGNAKLFCVGDSTTSGGAPVADQANAWPSRLANYINSYVAPCSRAYFVTKAGTATDTRVSITGSWVSYGNGLGDGSYIIALASQPQSGTLTFTPGYVSDTIELVFYTNGSTAVTVNVDGGSNLTLTNSGSASGGYQRMVATTTPGTHVWNVVATNANAWIAINSARIYNSGTKQVHVNNVAMSGTTTQSNFPNWTSSGNFQQLTGLTAYAPDLTVIALGINDTATVNGPVTLSAYLANLTTIINTCKAAGGDVLLTTWPQSGDTAAHTALEDTFIAALPGLAQSLQVPLLDTCYYRWGPYTTSAPAGYMADTLHPSNSGYADWAQAVLGVIRQC